MKVDKTVIEVLAGCEMDENLLKLPGQLDRKLYEKVSKILKGIGGKWNSARKAFVFSENVEDIVADIVNTGEFISEKQTFQFFPTPVSLARHMVHIAEIMPGELCLEPSAGIGNIAQFMPYCDCVELNENNRKVLVEKGFNVVHDDFMTFQPEKQYDVIIMNPPFRKGQDAEHIMKAVSIAGRVVIAIASASVMFHSGRKYKDLRELISKYNGTIEELPAGSFKESGTAVNAVLITVFTNK